MMAPQIQILDDPLILAGIDQRVKLNVGGVKYETTMEQISLLPKLFNIANERWSVDPESEIDVIFVDRNGLRFAYCLDYVRDGEVAIPSSITVESLVRDLEYYEVSNISPDSIKNTEHGLPEMMASITLMSKRLGDDIKFTSRQHTFLLFIKAVVKYAFSERGMPLFANESSSLRIKFETWDYLFHQSEHVYNHLAKEAEASEILAMQFDKYCGLRFKSLSRHRTGNETSFVLSFEP